TGHKEPCRRRLSMHLHQKAPAAHQIGRSQGAADLLVCSGGGHTAPRSFERTTEADRQKKFSDFKRWATDKLRWSAKRHCAAHSSAACLQRVRLAGADSPMSGQSIRKSPD